VRTLVISDLQSPFHHQDALPFLLSVSDKYRCNNFVCIGDETDNSTISTSFVQDPDGIGFKEEFGQALDFLKKMYKLWPKMSVCISNHGIRPFKKAFNAGLPSIFLKSYEEFLEAPPGWRWADEFEFDGVRYVHGDGVAGQLGHIKMAEKARISTCIGHIHSYGGVNYLNNYKGQLIWAMNVGCLIDVKSYAFKYGKHFLHKPTLGCGIVLDGIPFFIPMLLNSKGRWIGKLP
jgi:hypothetical protein